MNRREEVQKQGKHKLHKDYMAMERAFFRNYNEDMTDEEMKLRYAGVYGTDRYEAIPKKQLERIWRKFIINERIDYITMNNTVSVDEIVSIGIDKFVKTNGWRRAGDVANWRANTVRVGKCPECNDQFIPMMMQTNHGLCDHCRPAFSVTAIKAFVEHTISTNERYFRAHQDALMDFYIMFYNDRTFRTLFRKGSDSAKEFEEREFVLPEWFLEQQEQDMAVLQQNLLDMVPEERTNIEPTVIDMKTEQLDGK